MKPLEVVAGILLFDHKILCMQRGQGRYAYLSYHYEFPGGKVEPGERLSDALRRELREELSIHVPVRDTDFFLTVHHTYPDFSIVLHSFLCPVPSPDFVLCEHVAYQWLAPEDMARLPWAAADYPILEQLQKKTF